MEKINLKILKGTIVKIEGYPFQLTSSLEIPVCNSLLKLEGHTLIKDYCNSKKGEEIND